MNEAARWEVETEPAEVAEADDAPSSSRRVVVWLAVLGPVAHLGYPVVATKTFAWPLAAFDTVMLCCALAFGIPRTFGTPRSRTSRRVSGDGRFRVFSESRFRRQSVDPNTDLQSRVKALLAASDTMAVAFQPVIDLRDGTTVGVEALARFADGRSPTEWFAEAHELGLGAELEIRAITLALQMAESGHQISVNLSPSTLAHHSLATALSLRPDVSVTVELTEHAVVDDYAAVLSSLEPLRSMGVRVAVDDAGSGFASMRHIVNLRPDIVKIDRSLISSLHIDGARRALAASLVHFANGIGADLIAEGVELPEELLACKQLGIGYAQGYLLGRPAIVSPVEGSL